MCGAGVAGSTTHPAREFQMFELSRRIAKRLSPSTYYEIGDALIGHKSIAVQKWDAMIMYGHVLTRSRVPGRTGADRTRRERATRTAHSDRRGAQCTHRHAFSFDASP